MNKISNLLKLKVIIYLFLTHALGVYYLSFLNKINLDKINYYSYLLVVNPPLKQIRSYWKRVLLLLHSIFISIFTLNIVYRIYTVNNIF